MDAQQTFDTVAKHLITQGKPARATVTCYYRFGPLKCAVGVLIPDDLYIRDMEMHTVGALLDDFPQLKPLLGDNLSLLGDLQQVHDERDSVQDDGNFNLDRITQRLATVALNHRLIFNPEALA